MLVILEDTLYNKNEVNEVNKVYEKYYNSNYSR